MKKDLRHATDTVKSLRISGSKERYIDLCDLDPRDIEILKRVWVHRQSRVKIALEMHMSERSVHEHYRDAMIALEQVINELRRTPG
jgi:DNA-binding NarL/FixJ family response regulator